MPAENGQNSKNISGLIPFQPGISGNPSGRPKYDGINARIRKKLETITDPATRATVADELVAALFKEAMRGNVVAFREIRECAQGKLEEVVSGRLSGNLTLTNETSDSKRQFLVRLYRRIGVTGDDAERFADEAIARQVTKELARAKLEEDGITVPPEPEPTPEEREKVRALLFRLKDAEDERDANLTPQQKREEIKENYERWQRQQRAKFHPPREIEGDLTP